MSQSGQTEKHSARADVFRSSPKNGRRFSQNIARIECYGILAGTATRAQVALCRTDKVLCHSLSVGNACTGRASVGENAATPQPSWLWVGTMSARWYRDNVGLAEASKPDIVERHDNQVMVMTRNQAGVTLISFGG